jgi:hypothetical protein
LKFRTTSRAVATACRPSAVNVTDRVVRSNTRNPNSPSIRRMASLSAGCVIDSAAAALLKLPASAAATRISSWRIVRFIG